MRRRLSHGSPRGSSSSTFSVVSLLWRPLQRPPGLRLFANRSKLLNRAQGSRVNQSTDVIIRLAGEEPLPYSRPMNWPVTCLFLLLALKFLFLHPCTCLSEKYATAGQPISHPMPNRCSSKDSPKSGGQQKKIIILTTEKNTRLALAKR